jgi:MFS family permease
MWLVVVAKSVSWLGDEAALVAMTLRLQSQGHGAGAVAALLIANLLPIVLLSGVVGRLLDRRDNRSLLIVSSLAQAAVCTVLAFTSTPWAILVLVAVLGGGQAINAATWQALAASRPAPPSPAWSRRRWADCSPVGTAPASRCCSMPPRSW